MSDLHRPTFTSLSYHHLFWQYGGPDGEMSASMRYLSQRFAMPYKIAKGTLTDIGSGASEMCKTAAPLYDRRCGCQKGIFRLVPKAL